MENENMPVKKPDTPPLNNPSNPNKSIEEPNPQSPESGNIEPGKRNNLPIEEPPELDPTRIENPAL